jgi:hypothetical protein
MLLVRYILIFLIVYLLVRGFIRSFYLEDPPKPRPRDEGNSSRKKISPKVGEFVDYEEIKDKK